MRIKGIIGWTLIVAAAALLFGSPAGAKSLYNRKVTKPELEAEGAVVDRGKFETIKGFPGWRTEHQPDTFNKVLPVPSNSSQKIVKKLKPGEISPEKGTIVVWFYYDAKIPRDQANHVDGFFSLWDNNQRPLFTINLFPATYSGDGLLMKGSSAYIMLSNKLESAAIRPFGNLVRFADDIPERRWSYIAVTWGPNPKTDNRMYLNGKPAASYYATPVPSDKPAATDLPFGEIIRQADSIVFGGSPHGWGSLWETAIGEVEIRDEIMTSFNYPPRGLPVIKSFSDDSFKATGISGKLVAGDKVNFTLEAEPGGKAFFDFGEGKRVPMVEDAMVPGRYTGTYAIPPGIFDEKAKAKGYFTDGGGVEAEPVLADVPASIDSRSRFALSIDKTDLPADSASTSRVKVKVTDANGNPLPDHRIKVTLATTDEYTGLVGGGSTRSRDIAAAVKDQLAGAEVESLWKGVTDTWGEADFDYKAGFAAKTVILQVKDMTAGNVGADFITSYKEATIDIALTPPVSKAATRRGLQYLMKVEATRTELTADGRSRSVIRATLLDPNGRPVAGEPVLFSLSSPNGELRVVSGTTDSSGTATAEYIAGKKIGIVVVSASARGATGSVSIVLLADAPAKIYLKARPATLPADGFSRADLDVKVTDINDNPNKDTKVEFRIARGGGKIDYPDRVTDTFGDTKNRYTAGTTPGIATIAATVRSKVPTEAELAKARNVLFVPYTSEGEEIRISKWLKKKGDTAAKGEPVLEYTIGRGGAAYFLAAPYDCRIDFQYVEYWDFAKTGDTLAQVTPVVIPGSAGSTPPPPATLAPRRR